MVVNAVKKEIKKKLMDRWNLIENFNCEIPSVLIVSLPKSGTVYINEALQNLGLKNVAVSNGYFPVDQLNLEALSAFSEGGRIASVHIDPSPENMQLLEQFIPRWIVHVRDPRSSTLSWFHHTDRMHQEGHYEMKFRLTPSPSDDYFDASLHDRIQWQIENYLPLAVSWIEKWIAVADERFLITEYSDLRNKEKQYIEKITKFLNFPFDSEKLIVPERDTVRHFRTGTTDEWRTAFTSEQIEQASAMIPQSLKERFGWG